MALPGELLGVDGAECPECHRNLSLEVLESPAGFYLGYYCPEHGPISRETSYFMTAAKASIALQNPKAWSRDTAYTRE